MLEGQPKAEPRFKAQLPTRYRPEIQKVEQPNLPKEAHARRVETSEEKDARIESLKHQLVWANRYLEDSQEKLSEARKSEMDDLVRLTELERDLKNEKEKNKRSFGIKTVLFVNALGLAAGIAESEVFSRVTDAIDRGERVENVGDLLSVIIDADRALPPAVTGIDFTQANALENARFEVRKEVIDARFDNAAEMLESFDDLKREFGREEIHELAGYVEAYDIEDFWKTIQEKSELDLDVVSAHFNLRGVAFYSDATLDSAVREYEDMIQSGELREFHLAEGESIEGEFGDPAGLYAQGFVFINLSNVDQRNGLVAGVDDVLKHELMHGFWGYEAPYLNEGMTEWMANQLHADVFPEYKNSHAGYAFGREMTASLIAEVVDNDPLVWQAFIQRDYDRLDNAFDTKIGKGALSASLLPYAESPRLGPVDDAYLANEMVPLMRMIDILGERAEGYVAQVNAGRSLDSGRLLLINEELVKGALITSPSSETGILNGSLRVTLGEDVNGTLLTLGDNSNITKWAEGRSKVSLKSAEGTEFRVRPNIWTEFGGSRARSRGDELFSSDEALRRATSRLVEIED